MIRSNLASLYAESMNVALDMRNKGNFKGSIYLISKLIEENPDEAPLYFYQGLNYMNTGRLVIAIGFFNKYLVRYPCDARCWSLIGFCVLKYTCYTDSIFYLRSAISYGANDSDVFANLGEAYFRSNSFSKALNCLQKAHILGGVRDKKRLYDFMFRSADNISNQDKNKIYEVSDCCYLVVKDLKQTLNIDNILCIGDSHTLIFERISGLDVFQTGSPTAYNLISEDSQSQSIAIIRELLAKYKPASTAVMLTYAEIDIRNHIYKQMIIRGISINDACSIVVNRYCMVISEIESLGFKLLINGPFGSGFGVPRVGCEEVRNEIALMIDSMLSTRCHENGWIYHSLCGIIIDCDYKVNRGYFGDIDDNHLNKSSELCYFILASFLQKARQCYPRLPDSYRPQNTQFTSMFFQLGSNNLPISSVSSINNSAFVHNDSRSLKYDQVIISLADHFQVSNLLISLDSSFVTDNLSYKLSLRDSQMNELSVSAGNVSSRCLISHSCSSVWTWYICLELDACMSPYMFTFFSIK